MCSHQSGKTPGRLILQNNVVPQHYRVLLEPNLDKFTYTGEVEIDLAVEKPTNKVSVNILDLTIHSAELNGQKASSDEVDTDAQSITWTFPEEVKPGNKATLKVTFDGTLNDQLAGFYRSVHKDEQGNQKVVATTQMEATDCRRAFPCFDEPALKATFDIEIIADKKYTVLSNSDVKSTEVVESGKILTKFNPTPKMSTYLVAFIVGELEYVESKEFRLPVRVYATPGLAERCQFSADLAAKTLAFFEKTFGIEYPLPKLDMIGIHDFSAGAMENWGLITYRNVDLFFEEGKDAAFTKIRVAEVVQHELAHQWFGNLVTMDWWDGLWLNEGFATWMSWYSCNNFFPDWKPWESYVSNSLQGCLDLDGLRASHPIQVPVKRADEISQIFDAISYLKGSCVIRMISQNLGEEVFMKGISNYLKKHQYANTTTDDLWNALSEVSGKDVKSLMDVWTLELGYPILTVVEEDGKELEITQNRYLRSGDVKPEEDKVIYPVGLGLRTGEGDVKETPLFDKRTIKISYDGEFYKLNADQNGIYRVKYPHERVEKLASEGAKGNAGKLTVEDRIGLVTDLAAQAGAYGKTSEVLTLVDAWKGESETSVWQAILPTIAKVRRTWLFEAPETVEGIRKLRESLFVPKAKELGHDFSPNDTFHEETLKTLLFSSAVATGNKEFVDLSLNLYSKGFETINSNLRAAVFDAVAEYGTKQQWEELLAIYTDGTNGVTGDSALGALGATHDLALKQRLLDSLLDGTIRRQNVALALSGLVGDREGAELAWSWLQKNYEEISTKFPPSLGQLGSIVSQSIRSFTKPEQLEEVTAFFANKDLKGIEQAVNVSKDRISNASKWVNTDSKDVQQWLKQHNYLN